MLPIVCPPGEVVLHRGDEAFQGAHTQFEARQEDVYLATDWQRPIESTRMTQSPPNSDIALR
jgi:hypothetical protein